MIHEMPHERRDRLASYAYVDGSEDWDASVERNRNDLVIGALVWGALLFAGILGGLLLAYLSGG